MAAPRRETRRANTSSARESVWIVGNWRVNAESIEKGRHFCPNRGMPSEIARAKGPDRNTQSCIVSPADDFGLGIDNAFLKPNPRRELVRLP